MTEKQGFITQEQHDTYVEAIQRGAANKEDIKIDLARYFPSNRITAVLEGILWDLETSEDQEDNICQYNTNQYETNPYTRRTPHQFGYKAEKKY